MHWDHDADYLHHFEEEETIVDRMQYIHKFYLHRDQVKIFHSFNHRGDFYYNSTEAHELKNKNRYEFEDHFYHNLNGPAPPNEWSFNPDFVSNEKYIDMKLIKQSYVNKKIVVWRSYHNAEIPRKWKRKLTNYDWDVIIEKLRREGLHVVELTYRTPIREAMFHLQTCRLSLSYDGMWHYVAKNLCIPMAIVSDGAITKYHTPEQECVILNHSKRKVNSIWKNVKTENISEFLGETKKRSDYHKRSLRKYKQHLNLESYLAFFRRTKKGPTLLDKGHRNPRRKKKRK